MVDIFLGASRVLSWLHQSDESIERGLRLVDHLSRRMHRSVVVLEDNSDKEKSSASSQTIHNSGSSGTKSRKYVKERVTVGAREVSDLTALLELPYFRHLWM